MGAAWRICDSGCGCCDVEITYYEQPSFGSTSTLQPPLTCLPEKFSGIHFTQHHGRLIQVLLLAQIAKSTMAVEHTFISLVRYSVPLCADQCVRSTLIDAASPWDGSSQTNSREGTVDSVPSVSPVVLLSLSPDRARYRRTQTLQGHQAGRLEGFPRKGS